MPRFEFHAWAIVESDEVTDEATARELAEEACAAANKDPDQPHFYLDDGPGYVVDEEG